MDLVILILSIVYLCGVNCGKALAICTIVEVFLLVIKKIVSR